MPKAQKQERGLYIEIVMYGHGAHEIMAQWNVPIDKIDELQKVIEGRPDLFTERE